jgi:DNA-directed RNA polymerase specialized sigma24 family protein
MERPPPGSDKTTRLDQVETDWSMVHEPAQLVMRYAHAVQSYFEALIKNKHDAEEVAQEFFRWVSQHGLPRARQDRGRLRDYLKKVVRNTAWNFLRRKHPDQANTDLPAEGVDTSAEQAWMLDWRRCLFRRAWARLQEHQQRAPESLYYTVLRLRAAHAKEDSTALAARATRISGKTVRADAFRKQLSRARRFLAHILVDEVSQTLSEPTPVAVEAELAALGLVNYVRSFRPSRRRVPTDRLEQAPCLDEPEA